MNNLAKLAAFFKTISGVPYVPKVLNSDDVPKGNQQLVTDAYGKTKWETKTHYNEGKKTITWDGDITDLVNTGSRGYYKISSLTPPLEKIINKDFEWTADGPNASSITISGYSRYDWGVILTCKDIGVVIVTSLPAKQGTNNFPETGFYTKKGRDNKTYLSSFSWGTLKQLDEKFIPDTIARTADVPVIQTATVGQTIAVKAVDENGKPTEWEAVDAGSGGAAHDLVITHTQDSEYNDVYTSNMTYDEVLDALKNNTLTGAYYLSEAYYPADEESTASGRYYKTPIDIMGYWSEEDYIDQLVLSFIYIDSEMEDSYLKKLYLGSWGVSKYLNGEEEV